MLSSGLKIFIFYICKRCDLAVYFEYSFKNIVNYCQTQMKMVLIKCCDISNEVRPMEVSEPWVDCLLEEYFNQVALFLLRPSWETINLAVKARLVKHLVDQYITS